MVIYISLLNALKLGFIRKNYYVVLKYSIKLERLLLVLLRVNYINNYYFYEGRVFIILNIDGKKNIKKIQQDVSKVHVHYRALYTITKNIIILSTPFGLMTHYEARHKKVSGYILCVLY